MLRASPHQPTLDGAVAVRAAGSGDDARRGGDVARGDGPVGGDDAVHDARHSARR